MFTSACTIPNIVLGFVSPGVRGLSLVSEYSSTRGLINVRCTFSVIEVVRLWVVRWVGMLSHEAVLVVIGSGSLPSLQAFSSSGPN